MGSVLTFNGHGLKFDTGSGYARVGVLETPPGPPSIPPYTIRLKYSQGEEPTPYNHSSATKTLVDTTENIWDVTLLSSDWSEMLWLERGLIEIVGGNTTGVTNMSGLFRSSSNLSVVNLFDLSTVTNTNGMFSSCSSIRTIPLFDTSNVTDSRTMFYSCTSLTSIPLFNTSKIEWSSSMFDYCKNVESGSLALYQQMSSQTNPPTYHNYTFRSCGRDTVTGAAELAQIPSDWK